MLRPLIPDDLEKELSTMKDGLLFPWPELNQLVKIDPGVLTIVGAATSHGKTTFEKEEALVKLARESLDELDELVWVVGQEKLLLM